LRNRHDRLDEPSPPGEEIVTGEFDVTRDYWVVRTRGSRSWLVTLTLAGSGWFRWPEATVTTAPGDLVLIPSGVAHDYLVPAGGRWRFVWAHFQPPPAWASWLRLPELASGARLVRLSEAETVRAAAAFERLRLASPERVLGRALALNALEEVLLIAAAAAPEGRPTDPRIRAAIAMIEAAPQAAHTSPSLARHVHLSPSRFAHLFQAETGSTPMAMLRRVRLQRARTLLEHAPYTLGHIAHLCGFESAQSLSRAFKREHGVSPRQQKKAALQQVGERAERRVRQDSGHADQSATPPPRAQGLRRPGARRRRLEG
jgi:AraC family transcriptional regulator of arabinose operon